MATEVQKFVQKAGYEPLEDRCIIVKYAPANLSEQFAAFFNSEFYVLQIHFGRKCGAMEKTSYFISFYRRAGGIL